MSTATGVRVQVLIEGVVQGVGFRPFVHRLATELGLSGFVGNDSTSVFVEVEGAEPGVSAFLARVRSDAPPLAYVASVRATPLPPTADGESARGFRIVASESSDGARTLVPPDTAVCDDCVRELFDPADRRYRHPFITCTNCGPRFTIIESLPYDRPATTMAGFPMCPACRQEYEDPADRRFHAQPVACPDCGPRLWFEDAAGGRTDGSDTAVSAAQLALNDGQVVAVKGVGGYHLACAATADATVALLRDRKHRPAKPFAVMVADLDAARRIARVDDDEARLLTSPAHPIVLLRRRPGSAVSGLVAPGNARIGVLLPYTPVHHLLFSGLELADGPAGSPAVLVMTSGNRTDEPICYRDDDARRRLAGLADAFLVHDRPIHRPCDDSVVQLVDGELLPLRRSRGYAPLPVDLGRAVATVLATGGELKNTACLTSDRYAVLSQHLGDMESLETLQEFDRSTESLGDLYGARAAALATDCHPGYATRSWATRNAAGRPVLAVQHHHAHVVSLLAEHGRLGELAVGVAFDGTGFGTDGTIWGGELLALGADPTVFERAGHLRPMPLPGGDAAVRTPSRVALAYLDACGLGWDPALPPVAATSAAELSVLRQQLDRGLGCVPTTSMGRLFDAVSSLLGVRHQVSFEAQAAIELEAAAERALTTGGGAETFPRFCVRRGGVMDAAPVLGQLAEGVRAQRPVDELALAFHHAVADVVLRACLLAAVPRGISVVGLTGGVFQNAVLLRLCRQRLRWAGFDVISHHVVPPNDGGLALGQAAVAALTLSKSSTRADKES